MIRTFSYILFIIIISSCSNQNKDKQNSQFDQSPDDIYSDELFAPSEASRMSNPAIIMGSDFGSFIQSIHRLGKYEEMIKYTSYKTINQFGKDSLIKFYSNMIFNYDLELKSYDTVQNILYYNIDLSATKRRLSMPITIEKDTVKLIFTDLNFKEPFKLN